MEPEQIKTIQQAIGGFAWNCDYRDFLLATGWNDDSVAREKWTTFVALNRALGEFDPYVLSKLANYKR